MQFYLKKSNTCKILGWLGIRFSFLFFFFLFLFLSQTLLVEGNLWKASFLFLQSQRNIYLKNTILTFNCQMTIGLILVLFEKVKVLSSLLDEWEEVPLSRCISFKQHCTPSFNILNVYKRWGFGSFCNTKILSPDRDTFNLNCIAEIYHSLNTSYNQRIIVLR